jgi:hypothetical protein
LLSGKGRLSGLSCAAILLTAVLFLNKYIGQVPMVALVAVLWSVCLETFGLRAWKSIHKMPLGDAVTMVSGDLHTSGTLYSARLEEYTQDASGRRPHHGEWGEKITLLRIFVPGVVHNS